MYPSSYPYPQWPDLPGILGLRLPEYIEYFWDTDPGLGNGTNQSLPGGNDLTSTFTLSVGNLTLGSHFLGLRVQTNTGQWSSTRIFPVLIIPTSTATSIVRVEYFVDTDPGQGVAQSLPFTPNSGADVSVNTTINIGLLSAGNHLFFARAQDNHNTWSAPHATLISVLGSCVSLQTGQWSSATTWSCNRVPTFNDIVQLNAGHTVSIGPGQSEAWELVYQGGKINVNSSGKLFIRGTF